MYEFLTQSPLYALIFVFIVVLVAVYLFVKAMQNIGLEKVRGYVYQLFVKAEHEFEYGENTQKFEYVVQLARSALPSPFSLFVTEWLLREVIQLWFDMCKDLLDDGRINGSEKVNES